MSRNKGIASFSGNFEPQAAAPLDARCIVETISDLLDASVWEANDGGTYVYAGMVVSVYQDPDPDNNGLYILLDPTDVTDINSWERAGAASIPPIGSSLNNSLVLWDGNGGDEVKNSNLAINSLSSDLMLVAETLYEETVLIDEEQEGGFELGPTFADNGWTVVNSQAANKWEIGSAAVLKGNRGAYISNNNGTSNAYTLTAGGTSHFYRDVTVPVGFDRVRIKYWIRVAGENQDYARVYAGDPNLVSVPSNALINATYAISPVLYSLGSEFVQIMHDVNVTPGSDLRVAFSWTNNFLNGNQPPAAIDNISIVAYDTNSPIGKRIVETDIRKRTHLQGSNRYSGISLATSDPNATLVLEPKGFGALTAQFAMGNAATGNNRGNQAVDFQRQRAAAGQVASGVRSFIGSGSNNTAAGQQSVIVGGANNSANNSQSVTVGGTSNSSFGAHGAVLGGQLNSAGGNFSTVSGGFSNNASRDYAAILGGQNNTASGLYTAILGGRGNVASESYSVIVGGQNNSNSQAYSFIGAGIDNFTANTASYSFIGAGENNQTNNTRSVCVGGRNNNTSGGYGFIGGGDENFVGDTWGAICGGRENSTLANYGFVGGGRDNTARGLYSAVLGGRDNDAREDYSTALGREAVALNQGEFAIANGGDGLHQQGFITYRRVVSGSGDPASGNPFVLNLIGTNSTDPANHFTFENAGTWILEINVVGITDASDIFVTPKNAIWRQYRMLVSKLTNSASPVAHALDILYSSSIETVAGSVSIVIQTNNRLGITVPQQSHPMAWTAGVRYTKVQWSIPNV